ncbi:MAG: hypothetical protein D6812_17320 [Deltaproteobacteria bacterium]|nr:MAG: hypothetical protein D6812_17320 [Deltaproteobacteria bacterium]
MLRSANRSSSISIITLAAVGLSLAASATHAGAETKKDQDLAAFASLYEIPPLAEIEDPAKGHLVGEVGDLKIYDEQLEETLKGQLYELQKKIYTYKKQLLDRYIEGQLIAAEARKEGVSPAELFAREVLAKVKDPTEEEARDFWEKNKGRSKRKFEEMRARVIDYMKRQRIEEARQAWLDTLRQRYPTKVLLPEPQEPRFQINVGDRALRGNPNASVTIVEFSDFQCPYCQRASGTIEQVMEKYGDRVKLAFVDYPLPFHDRALPAAIAARCAGEQNKFWEYHDLLFKKKKFNDKDFEKYAEEIGLDLEAFKACFDSQKYAAQIEQDKALGNQVGVTGTPAFFINGRKLSGAQPFSAFEKIIEEELSAADAKE